MKTEIILTLHAAINGRSDYAEPAYCFERSSNLIGCPFNVYWDTCGIFDDRLIELNDRLGFKK